MIHDLVRAMMQVAAIYWYHVEGQVVKREKGKEVFADCLTSLTSVSNFLKEIKGASSIVEEANSWKEKLDKKYSVGEKIDADDAKELSKASWEWYRKLTSIAQEFDKEQRTLELIEERMKKVEKGVEPILENIKGYMSRIQSSTLTFAVSSPTERSLEPTLRGLLNRTNSGELALTGYFD